MPIKKTDKFVSAGQLGVKLFVAKYPWKYLIEARTRIISWVLYPLWQVDSNISVFYRWIKTILKAGCHFRTVSKLVSDSLNSRTLHGC